MAKSTFGHEYYGASLEGPAELLEQQKKGVTRACSTALWASRSRVFAIAVPLAVG
jgi:hypothetical protein